jgi:exosome complex component RRP41
VLGEDSPRGVITVSFTVAPFATSERRPRRAGDRKLVEAAGALRQCFEAVVHTRLYPRSEIAVTVQVLASDGGALVAALNAGTLALIDAGVAVRDFVAAAAALHPPLGGAPLMDPCHAETLGGAPELVVALLPGSDAAVLVSMESRLPADAFAPLLAAASAGARQTYEALRGFVGERAASQLAAREGRVGGFGAGGEEEEEDGRGVMGEGEEEEGGGGGVGGVKFG